MCTQIPDSSCQSAAFSAVNAFTSRLIEPAARAPKSIGLRVKKQVLCQTGKIAEISVKNVYKTIGSTPRIRVIRNPTMSSHCRCFRTTISDQNAKLLIQEGSDAVAEGRQGRTKATQRNNNNKQPTSHTVCRRCDKNTKKNCAAYSIGTEKRPYSCSNSDGQGIGAARDDVKVCKSNILHCVLSLIFDITSALVRLLYCVEI